MFLWHLYHPIELESAYFHVILALFIIVSAIDHGYKVAVEKGIEDTSMRVLSVVSHPRKDSLTFQVADRFVQGLAEITHLLKVGIADYCGVSNAKVEFLYETLDSIPKHYEMLLNQAYHLGLNYAKE